MKIGDLCWAKMKGYPSWPGKILDGPDSEKNRFIGKKKLRHYIYFFGSGNYAWVEANKIKPNSEKIINQASHTRWMPLRKAIQQLKRDMAVENYYRQGIVKKCQVRIERLNPDTSRQLIVKNCQVKLERLGFDTSQQSTSLTLNEALSPELCRNKVRKSQKSFNTESMADDAGEKSTKCQEIMPKKFGFIGHGEIGREIAKNLLKSKCDVTIWSQTSNEYVLSDVHQTADSFLHLIVSCDIILCCIDSEDKAQSFLKGDQGILQSFKAIKPCDGKGFALLANVDLKDSADTAAKIQASGARYIEASMIGSEMQAINGELLILCSGDQSLFHDCKAAFVSFRRVKYLGPDITYAPKFHTIMGLFLNCVSKSYKETISLIKTLELPLPIFNDLLKTVFDESYLTTLSQDPLEKKFSQVDKIQLFLNDVSHKTLLEINFPTETSFNTEKFY